MRVYVVALDGVFDLGLSAILDAFQTANELIEMTGLAVPRFEVKIVGMRKTVRTSHGLKVRFSRLEDKSLNALLSRQLRKTIRYR